MRYFILILSALICSQAYAQFGCYQHSRLYIFDKNSQPRHFTERLGNHPEFPFLQEINGVTTPDLFIKAIRDPEKQRRYAREFKAFDLLLRNSGFKHGYKDLSEKNVEDIFVAYGTIGNLGFYDKKKDLINYLYVRLNPAGEPAEGVAAWRLTNAAGCYLYILHTCGNAFYPYNPGDCCKAVSVESHIQFLKQPDSAERSLQLTLNLYQASINASRKKRNGYDTVVKLIRHKDTVVHIKDKNSTPWKIYANDSLDKILICKDTVLKLYTQLLPDSSALAAANGKLKYILSDTVYLKKEEPKKEEEEPVENKWEVSLDAGKSWNSIPRFNNATQHTQTNGSQLTAELAISRILNHWLQIGVSASYIRLSYQDDSLYAGSVAGTYNTVWLGKRIIPVQLFAKATIGKPVGWQANVSISAGYAIPGDDRIENSGTTLTTRPNFKGGFTAGFRLGLAYFFTSHFGVGFSFTGQYFENKNNDEALMSYKPMALPIMGGVRVRF